MQLNLYEVLQAQVQEWLKEYSGADVAVAHPLCNRYAQTSDRVVLVYENVAGKEGG